MSRSLWVVLAEILFVAREFSRFAWPQGTEACQKRPDSAHFAYLYGATRMFAQPDAMARGSRIQGG